MAQMPIQSMSGRTASLPAAPPAAALDRAGHAGSHGSYPIDDGRISGGLLRPGAIDQEQFKAHLAAARQGAMATPPRTPPAPAPSPTRPGIPTLSPAQLAALGAVAATAGEPVIETPAPSPLHPGAQPYPRHAGGAGAAAIIATPGSTDATADGNAAAAAPATDAAAGADAPASSTPASATASHQAQGERGPIPGARRGADGAWELPRLPDKEERTWLSGQKWRVVESERSRALFLGPDGEFGWDDFLDVVNPLQHIPLVNIAYRAVTGDEIYGAARLVDFAFGPMAAVSTAVDLAFRDITGRSMADNAVAALFGPDEAGAGEGEVPSGINTASGAPRQPAGLDLVRRGSHK